MPKVTRRIFITLLILLFISLFGKNQLPSSFNSPLLSSITPAQKALNIQMAKVTRVVDGDTIEIDTGEKVRLIGINTPETVDPRTPVQCYGKEASDKTKQLLEGQTVKLEKDVSDKDKYGRLLRYVYKDSLFVNEFLVTQGYAQVATYPPDVKYQAVFQKAQEDAKINNRGLWNSCPTSTKTN